MRAVTEKQKRVLGAIIDLGKQGTPPTVREIASHVGLSSSCSVQKHIEALEVKGFVRRRTGKNRAVEVLKNPDGTPFVLPTAGPGTIYAPLLPLTVSAGDPAPFPAMPEIPDGLPRMAFPQELVGEGEFYIVRVAGDSMAGRGIRDGAQVLVRRQHMAVNGDVVLAQVDREKAVLRVFHHEGKRVRLQSDDEGHPPIYPADLFIHGKVAMVLHGV